MSVAPPPMCPATSALVRLESALLFLREHWPMQTDTARVRWFVRGPRVAPHVDLHVWSDRTDPALPAVRVLRPYGSQETLALRLEQARAEFDRGVDVWQPAVPAALQALERFLPSDPRSTAHG